MIRNYHRLPGKIVGAVIIHPNFSITVSKTLSALGTVNTNVGPSPSSHNIFTIQKITEFGRVGIRADGKLT